MGKVLSLNAVSEGTKVAGGTTPTMGSRAENGRRQNTCQGMRVGQVAVAEGGKGVVEGGKAERCVLYST